MNLKESFRYQNFLDEMMAGACASIQDRNHGLIVTRKHMKSKANPEAEDVEEIVEHDQFVPNDIVIVFMIWLTAEKHRLTMAIAEAKRSSSLDIDAAIEANKYRQKMRSAIKSMLRYAPSVKTERGQDYKFNMEGNQVPYYYDIEVTSEEAYSKKTAKDAMREAITKADKVSSDIDAVMVNTVVDYTPVYDVNESFEDVIMAYADENYSQWRNS